MTVPVNTEADAWTRLAAAQKLIEPELRRAVGRIGDPVRTVAEYHFGWRNADGSPAEAGWGKGVRGALVLTSAEALGAVPERAVPAAVAVELVHNFTLLHDDVMDGDHTRRGRCTARAAFDDAQAILAGDALLALSLDVVLTDLPRAGSELCRTMLDLVAGQGADVSYESRLDVDLEMCLSMAAGKTASLLACACAVGALAAHGDPNQVGALRDFGHHLGMAFQLVDDLLGIWGDPQVTRKPVGADLRRRKKSLPVVFALTSGTAAGAQLAALYRRPQPMTDAEVRRAADLVEEAGGRRWTYEAAVRHRAQALTCLEAASCHVEGKRALTELADLTAGRNR